MPQLFFREFGEGEPLVILHGLLGSSDNWVTLGKKYAQRFHVVIPDQRNHGQSFHADEFDYDHLAEDLHHLLESMGLYGINLIGHSMGGKAAMHYALQNAGAVKKLLVADMAPKVYEMKYDDIFRALNSIHIEKLTSRGEAEDALAIIIDDFGMRQFLLKNLGRNSDGFAWKPNLAVIESNIQNLGKWENENLSFKGSALFINGSKSGYVKANDKEEIIKAFPISEFASLDAGHWLHAEQPNEFYEVTAKFLAD